MMVYEEATKTSEHLMGTFFQQRIILRERSTCVVAMCALCTSYFAAAGKGVRAEALSTS